jgi:hypothetical protein
MVSEWFHDNYRKCASIHLEFPCRHSRRQPSGTLLSSATSDWHWLPLCPTKCPSIAGWCSTTFSSFISEILEQHASRTMVGQHGPAAWPAYSPHLNPLDFYLWRHINSTAYATEVSGMQNLQQ